MDDKVKDKQKIQDILNEIIELQKLSNDLGNNVRGEKLEDYVDNLDRNIQLFNNKVEALYEDSIKTSD